MIRVGVWGPGSMGVIALRGVIDHPRLELVGVVVHSGGTHVWTGVVALVAFKIADLIVGLRPSEDVEREGLDISEHGETAYHM